MITEWRTEMRILVKTTERIIQNKIAYDWNITRKKEWEEEEKTWVQCRKAKRRLY